MKLILVTGDEFSKEEIFANLEEQELQILSIFDNGCKVIVEVPDSLPDDPDYKNLTILEYWSNVTQELFYPCCEREEGTEGAAYAITIGDYIRNILHLCNNFYDLFGEVIDFID